MTGFSPSSKTTTSPFPLESNPLIFLRLNYPKDSLSTYLEVVLHVNVRGHNSVHDMDISSNCCRKQGRGNRLGSVQSLLCDIHEGAL